MFAQLARRIRSIRVRELVRKLASGNEDSRIAAARSLAALHASEAVPALLDCLEYAQSKYLDDLGKEVINALRTIGDERAKPALFNHLLIDLTSGNEDSRIAAARSVAALHASEAVPALLNCLEYAHSKSLHNLREEATKALGTIGDERAIPALFNHLLFDPTFDLWDYFNPSAFDALVKIGGPKVLDGFVHTLEHRYSGIQILAAKALAKMGKSLVALDALQKRLDENEQNGKISCDLRRAISRDLRRAINEIRREGRTSPMSGVSGEHDFVNNVCQRCGRSREAAEHFDWRCEP
jgi:HEAT repeat protein